MHIIAAHVRGRRVEAGTLLSLAAWFPRTSRLLAGLRPDRRRLRRSPDAAAFVAAEVALLEERSLLSSGAVYSIAQAMNWGTTAPTYNTDVTYSSAGTWQSLNVVNYSPSHYVDFNSSGQMTFSDGSVLGDNSFQQNLQANSPYLYDYASAATGGAGQYVNYLQGNPQLLIYHDLAQLQANGFDGVRLYAIGPQSVISTILAANQLSQDTGKQFYVELEVFVPDLSQPQYYGGSVSDRIQTLFTQEVAATPPGEGSLVEGGLQQLHYVINIVGASVFSQTVPLVFFGHEDLVQPTSAIGQPLTDDNSSVPLLQWGINATRAILKYDLAGQGSLPSVTTALVAGQVVDVSTANNPEITKLINTIQADANAPIAYDVYGFQWANIYFDTSHSYTNGNGVVANAYPPGAQYYDTTTGWTTGTPPVAPTFTVADSVTNPDLMWSLQWMADRVNWIWGGRQTGASTKQLVAETGWASGQDYTQLLTGGGYGKVVTGNHTDAQAYFDAIKSASFKIGNAPVMYFEAYDEPVKEKDSHQYSENHYGIYAWTAMPKYYSDPAGVDHPLTKPFAIVTIAPTNISGGIVQEISGNLPTSTAYTLQVTNSQSQVRPGSSINVPWFWGTGGFQSGNQSGLGQSVTWMPNPSVFLSDGDTLTITSMNPGSGQPTSIQLTFTFDTSNPLNSAITDANPNAAGENLTGPTGNYTKVGSSWQLYLSFPWLHNGSNNYTNTAQFPLVYQDFWGATSQIRQGNLLVIGTPGDDTIRIVPVTANQSDNRRFNFGRSEPTLFQVFVNGQSLGTYGPFPGKIIVKGLEGNDTLIVDPSVKTPAVLDGGPGNDYLSAGRNAVMIGGSGRDMIVRGLMQTAFDDGWCRPKNSPVRQHAAFRPSRRR